MTALDHAALLEKANRGISAYLDEALAAGRIDKQLHAAAKKNTFPNLQSWVTDPNVDRISPNMKAALTAAAEAGRWEDIVNAYRQKARFGTGGIRGMMAFDKESIVRLKREGLDAPILKGPNTINNLVLLLTSAGVAKFGNHHTPRFDKVVVGYDSRIRGQDFASIVAQLFLAYGYTVYFFDAPCPYPEVTFAIPDESVKADIGILISASHNDYRYNGYKLSCGNGSQFDPKERDEMYHQYISKATFADVKLCPFADAPEGKLWFLGGAEPMPEFDYAGKGKFLINMHKRHLDHVRRFILTDDLAGKQRAAKDPLHVGFCAFHGAGRIAVPRLLRDVGFVDVNPITDGGLNDLDGLFPSFDSRPGHEQQPDPGDYRAAAIAAGTFKKQYPAKWPGLDILVGTDPDADRCGIIIKTQKGQEQVYGGKDYRLLSADEAWAVLIWYRLNQEVAKFGRVVDADKKFVVLSHTTTDAITRVARKYGLGVIHTWVGFASLSAAVRDVWDGKAGQFVPLKDGRLKPDQPLCHPYICDAIGMENGKRSFNVGAMEQSNGFSLLGGPPPDARSLGVDGHVRDKDGTLAALLMTEVAAWAKSQGVSLGQLVDEKIYLDPDVGVFANLYEPDPMDGEYPGIEGDRLKMRILRTALAMYQQAQKGGLLIGGVLVKSVCLYRTGKYDELFPPTEDFVFADEGFRFFFSDDRLSHLTVRPSGTGNSLRFHVQLHDTPHSQAELVKMKQTLQSRGKAILDDLREKLGAPRNNG
ncbi:MAG: hypothetical protein PHU85_04430 [Phycisphaerae bacterium]|nr:hypothetical protein [Phycisphaerae bacterium]